MWWTALARITRGDMQEPGNIAGILRAVVRHLRERPVSTLESTMENK